MRDDLIIKTIFKAIDRISAPVRRMSRGVGKFGRTASRQIGSVHKITSKMGKTIQRGVVRAFRAAAVAAVALGVAISGMVTTGAEFEKTMVSATAKFPEGIRRGSKEFESLEKTVRRLGATTEFKSSEAAEALNFLAMAGFNAAQSQAALPGVIDLATASEMELAQASDIATDSLNAFGLASKDAAELQANLSRVNDVLLKTTTSANTSMEDLFEAVKSGAPTVTAAGQDIETFGAMIGIMADSGKKGEQAGTALRNMFLRIQAPVGAAKGLIKKYVGDIKNADGSMIDIVEVFARLEKSFEKLGKVEQAQILDKIFGKRAIGAAQIMLEKGTDSIEQLRQKLLGASGAAGELAGEMRDTTAGSIDALKSSIESVIISLFKLDASGIKGVIDRMTEWVRANEQLIVQKVGAVIQWITDNWEKIVGVLKQVGGTVATLWTLSKAIDAVAAAMSFVKIIKAANPITLIIMAIVVAVALLAGVVIKNWDKIVEAWDRAVVKAKEIVNSIVGTFKAIIQFFQDAWAILEGIFWAGVKAIAGPGTPLGYMLEVVLVLRDAWSAFAEFMGDVWQGIKDNIGPVIDWIGDKIGWVYDKLGWIIKSIGRAISYVAGETASSVHEIAEESRKQAEVDKAEMGFGDQKVIRLIDRKISHEVDAVVRTQSRAGGEADVLDFYGGPHMTPAGRSVAITERKETTTTKKGILTIRDETGRGEYSGDDPFELGMSFEKTGTF